MQRLLRVSRTLLWTVSLTATVPLLLKPSAAVAQTGQTAQQAPTRVIAEQEQPRINVSGKRGSPRRRFGGGSRIDLQDCVAGPHAIAMIAPADNVTVTTSAQPTLMLWVNESMQNKNVEFALREGRWGDGPDVYRKMLTLPGEAGLVTLDLSTFDDVKALTEGEDYHIYLSLVCDASDHAKDVVSEGVLSYVGAELPAAKEIQQPRKRDLEAFASVEQSLELGLWHDAMVQLNHLRRQGQTSAIRQQAQQRWRQLLEADDELYVLAGKTENVVDPIAVVDAPELDLF